MIRREGYKFRQDICIPCYGTDSAFMLKPAAFMDFAQEIAYWAASELGFGYDQLHVHHTAWVLSRMHIHFEDYPCWRDNVSLFTWHKGLDGLFFIRDFFLDDAAGRHLVSCTSSWVIIDESTRRFVRPEEIQHLLNVEGPVDSALPEPAPKTAMPRQAQPSRVGSHTVSYSDVDIIGHTNNVRYVVWAMDVLPVDVSQKRVKDIFISFIKETTPGQEVELFLLETPEGYLVEGRVEDKPVFCVNFVF